MEGVMSPNQAARKEPRPPPEPGECGDTVDVFVDGDCEESEQAVRDTFNWLENRSAENRELKAKLKEMEGVESPNQAAESELRPPPEPGERGDARKNEHHLKDTNMEAEPNGREGAENLSMDGGGMPE
eukprot:13070801-Alexandrium_andersonii.AAC.1